MRITAQQAISSANRARSTARETAEGDASTATSSSRALIPVSPVQATARTADVLVQPAYFLAQLIATKQDLPQTRERRREEPAIAISAYSKASAIAPVANGRNFSRAA